MLKRIKQYFGRLKRGLIGYFINTLEKTPPIPKNIATFDIGESVKKQKINCYQIGHGTTKVLYVFCIHGNETGTVKLAHYFLNWSYSQEKKFNDYSIYIVPCLNPDGFELALKKPDYFNGGKIGRFNNNNVDLNRNFATPSFKTKAQWSFGKNYEEHKEVFCGNFGNSEPETKALIKLIKSKEIKVLFMFHNTGKDVMANQNVLAKKIAKIYSQKTNFKNLNHETWLNLRQTGTLKEWCDLNNVAYIEIEGSTRWGSDWKKQKEALQSTIFINKITSQDQLVEETMIEEAA